MTEQAIDVRHRDQGTQFEYVVVEVGGHNISISERDGDPHLYVFDHASVHIEGEHKDEVTVVVGTDEFPTDVVTLTEQQFTERYNSD